MAARVQRQIGREELVVHVRLFEDLRRHRFLLHVVESWPFAADLVLLLARGRIFRFVLV